MAMKKRPDGRYEKSIVLNGKRRTFYGRSQSELNQKIVAFTKTTSRSVSFSSVADEWERVHFETLEYNSLKTYKPASKRAKEYFDDMSIFNITPPMVDAFIKDFSKNKARKTVSNQLLVLRLIFDYACAHYGLQYNPAAAIKTPKGLPKAERPYPTKEQRTAVMEKTDVPGSLFMRTALRCGLRRGEICGLHGEDFNKEEHSITVRRSIYWVGNSPHEKTPKTQKGLRTVPVPDDLYEDLCALNAQKDDILFPREGGGYMKSHEVQRIVDKYKEYTNTNLTPHSYRHGYASTLYAGEVDVLSAQKLMGHAQASTTMNIYTHIEEIEGKKQDELRNKISKAK